MADATKTNTSSQNDEIEASLKRGQASIQDMCVAYTGQGADCSVANIVAGIMSKREYGWKEQEAEICADPSLGTSVEEKVKNAGLVEGTKLNCPLPSIAPR